MSRPGVVGWVAEQSILKCEDVTATILKTIPDTALLLHCMPLCNTYHTFARIGEIIRLHRMNKWVCAFNFSYHLMVVWYFEIAYQLFKGPLKGYADLLGLKY